MAQLTCVLRMVSGTKDYRLATVVLVTLGMATIVYNSSSTTVRTMVGGMTYTSAVRASAPQLGSTAGVYLTMHATT